MAFTDEESARVSLIESTLNKIMNWLANVPNRRQWRQMMLDRQETINNLTTRVATLESEMETIINRLDALPD